MVRELLLKMNMDTHPRRFDRQSSIARTGAPFGASDESGESARNPFNQVFIASAMVDLATASLCFRSAGSCANHQRSRSGNTAPPRLSRLTNLLR